jgi:hypothetical protein
MLDTYDEHNPNNPINQEEESELTDQELAEEYNWELKKKVFRLQDKLSVLKEDIRQLRDLSRGFSSNYLANKLQELLDKNT